MNLPTLPLQRTRTELEADVLAGFAREQKNIPAKYLYDERGSELFSAICDLEEYYPTRTEFGILREHAAEIAALIGPEAVIIEPGAGTGEKVRTFLAKLERPAAYVPIEIASSALALLRAEFAEAYPTLRVVPVNGDFTQNLRLPPEVLGIGNRRVVFFPGSTIGNFEPQEAVGFLREARVLAGRDGGLLIGVDLKKDPWVLLKAYDDAGGVTADFNLNLLRRLNREAGATFEPAYFYHEAIYNDHAGRVEMHLVSRLHQLVRVAGQTFRFRPGETIHTESAYKFAVSEFADLAFGAGWALRRTWQDRNHMFGVFYFAEGE